MSAHCALSGKNWRAGLDLVGRWLLLTSAVFYFGFPLLSEIMAGHGKHVDVLDWRLLANAITAFVAGGMFPASVPMFLICWCSILS